VFSLADANTEASTADAAIGVERLKRNGTIIGIEPATSSGAGSNAVGLVSHLVLSCPIFLASNAYDSRFHLITPRNVMSSSPLRWSWALLTLAATATAAHAQSVTTPPDAPTHAPATMDAVVVTASGFE